jgi:hypothetical protein
VGRLISSMLVLAGCVSTPTPAEPAPPAAARSAQQQRLDSLPGCKPGAEVGLLTLSRAICTKMHCEQACCNQCTWAATLETKSGQPVPVEAARVQELLGLGESALDCEILAWAEALRTQSVSVEAPGCVVR